MIVSDICDICSEQFTEEKSVRIHKNAIHFKSKFPCNLCDYKATHYSNLTTHNKLTIEK